MCLKNLSYNKRNIALNRYCEENKMREVLKVINFNIEAIKKKNKVFRCKRMIRRNVFNDFRIKSE